MDVKRIKEIAQREEEGVRVDFVHPEDEDERFWMVVAGANSERHRKARAAQQRRWIRDKRTKQTPAEIFQDRVEIAAACVISWGDLTREGQPITCTEEEVSAVLAEEWALKKVEAAMNDESAFFDKRSSA